MIYLDHHATTPVLPEVVEAMHPYWSEHFGNPSSAHTAGRRARQALEDARDLVASLLDARPHEVIFTSGATEANNLALFGLAGDVSGRLLASPLEHPCVSEPLKQLATRGFKVEWLPVQSNGSVGIEAVRERIRPDTRLLALMLINHETGARQPVAEIAQTHPHCPLHCDAAQAIGKTPFSFRKLHAVTCSASGHKFGGPKGVGVLLVRNATRLQPLLFGGHQQQGRRPGTEPVALAVGFARALQIAASELQQRERIVANWRRYLIETLSVNAAPIHINSPADGSPYVVNISFPGCRADLLLMKLDLMGVACSTGSACSSGSLLPSPVLQAMGLSDALLRSAMRFSFSSDLSVDQIDEASRRIIMALKDLRTE